MIMSQILIIQNLPIFRYRYGDINCISRKNFVFLILFQLRLKINMHSALQKNIHEYLRARKIAGLLRKLTTVKNHPKNLYLNLNDYLQLSKHPRIIHAAQNALEKWGTSSGGSPAVGSYWLIHEELENVLKEWCGFEYGLLWNSGYTANKALLSTLPQKGDVVLADRYVHNSMLLGVQEAGAKLIRYPHLN